MFIGHARTGHSLVGALLDGHPNIIIAHELNVLKYIQKGYNQSQIFYLLIKRSKEIVANGCKRAGYTYKVPEQWQGKYRKIKVIGDKKGGMSTKMLENNLMLLDKLDKVIKKKIKYIHVKRNPFDVITTIARKSNIVLQEINPDILLSSIEPVRGFHWELLM